ncbi:MAG: hypothetical protein ACK6DC_12550 [Planctomycetota bacterium]|jgi:hypothetical protein
MTQFYSHRWALLSGLVAMAIFIQSPSVLALILIPPLLAPVLLGHYLLGKMDSLCWIDLFGVVSYSLIFAFWTSVVYAGDAQGGIELLFGSVILSTAMSIVVAIGLFNRYVIH